MLWSKLFIPTLRDDPAESRNSTHRLLIRAGYMRRQDYLLLGRRAMRKIVSRIREQMDSTGGQEMLFSSAQSALTIATELRSYKQLPQIWYQFSGFTLECWTLGDGGARVPEAFRGVVELCGIACIAGREIIAFSENGEPILHANGYAASAEFAESRPNPPTLPDPEGDLAPEPFETPGQKTIAELAIFTGLPESSQMKSVVMMAGRKPVLVMLRGDHQLSEAKLSAHVSASELRPATGAEIREWFGADAGSLGPVGVGNMPVLADEALRGRRNMICGANRNDYHLRHVTPEEDFAPQFVDLRLAAEGEASIVDGAPLAAAKGIVLARFHPCRPSFTVTDETGEQTSAGAAMSQMFLDRLLETAAEQHHDSDGLALPPAIAPFAAVLTPVSNDPSQQRAARELYESFRAAGIDALLDDRDERPGVKFKDADLIGIPYRITIGKKLTQGAVEIRDRVARSSQDVLLAEAVSFLTDKLK